MRNVGFALVLGWLVISPGRRVHGAAFQISLTGVDSQRRPTLSLGGVTAGNYTLEASTNLTKWFTVATAPATTQAVSFIHSGAAQLGTVFYRGALLPEIGLVQPEVDPTLFTAGQITRESGGRLEVTNESGVRYTFTVGPSTL